MAPRKDKIDRATGDQGMITTVGLRLAPTGVENLPGSSMIVEYLSMLLILAFGQALYSFVDINGRKAKVGPFFMPQQDFFSKFLIPFPTPPAVLTR